MLSSAEKSAIEREIAKLQAECNILMNCDKLSAAAKKSEKIQELYEKLKG
jgi:cell fate (sporulation/competence/biofilm development) regulator YmcA (YheA/YmcA/DUF963 family)